MMKINVFHEINDLSHIDGFEQLFRREPQLEPHNLTLM